MESEDHEGATAAEIETIKGQILAALLDVDPAMFMGPTKKRWRREDLRKYQNRLVGLFKQCFDPDPKQKLPGLLLALEPGAGKTAIVLTALRELLDEGRINRALVVASVLVAQTVWPDEIDEWEHLKNTTWTLIRVEDDDPEVTAKAQAAYDEDLATFRAEVETRRQQFIAQGFKKSEARSLAKGDASPGERAEKVRQWVTAEHKELKLRALLASDTELHIINKEALPWLWDATRKGQNWPYDVMITDDLREGRSGKKRTKGKSDRPKGPAPLSRFGVMAQIRKKVKATIELTGTPTPNGLENLWGLSYLIDLGERLGTSKTAFLNRWFNINRYSFKATPMPHAFDEIVSRVKDIMFSLDPPDLAELPEFIINPIRVKLPDKILKEYKAFERFLVSEEYDVEAVNAAVMHGKLLQFANGSMYQEDGNDIAIHDCKIEALKELVDRLDGRPLLVAYTYQFDVDRICKAFPDAVVLTPSNSRKFVADWNADKIKIGLAHRASAGHGLNLQKGTGIMCEYGLTTDAELYLQFIKRIWRSGRKQQVVNHVIIASGTIDDEVFPMYLDPKIETQDQILKRLRLKA